MKTSLLIFFLFIFWFVQLDLRRRNILRTKSDKLPTDNGGADNSLADGLPQQNKDPIKGHRKEKVAEKGIDNRPPHTDTSKNQPQKPLVGGTDHNRLPHTDPKKSPSNKQPSSGGTDRNKPQHSDSHHSNKQPGNGTIHNEPPSADSHNNHPHKNAAAEGANGNKLPAAADAHNNHRKKNSSAEGVHTDIDRLPHTDSKNNQSNEKISGNGTTHNEPPSVDTPNSHPNKNSYAEVLDTTSDQSPHTDNGHSDKQSAANGPENIQPPPPPPPHSESNNSRSNEHPSTESDILQAPIPSAIATLEIINDKGEKTDTCGAYFVQSEMFAEFESRVFAVNAHCVVTASNMFGVSGKPFHNYCPKSNVHVFLSNGVELENNPVVEMKAHEAYHTSPFLTDDAILIRRPYNDIALVWLSKKVRVKYERPPKWIQRFLDDTWLNHMLDDLPKN